MHGTPDEYCFDDLYQITGLLPLRSSLCSDVIMKHGVCIRVLGDLELLPRDVLESVARAVNFSRHNDKAFLNVCFSYTSRHEMTEAVRRLATGAQEEMILPRCVCACDVHVK